MPLRKTLIKLAWAKPKLRPHLLPVLKSASQSRTASDFTLHSIEFVSGQEPTDTEDFATLMYASFTIRGALLAALLNKQARVLGRYLEKIKKDRTASKILVHHLQNPSGRATQAARKIQQALRGPALQQVVDYADEIIGYDDVDEWGKPLPPHTSRAAEVESGAVEFAVDSGWQPKVRIDPRKETVTFTDMELEVFGKLVSY